MVFSERACSGATRNNESLSNSVFERRTSTGSGLFASLGSGLVQTLGQIVFIREKKLSNTNLLESRHIKEKKASLPVDVRRSKTSLLKLPNEVLTTPHIPARKFSLFHFSSQKSSLFCSKKSTLYSLRTKEIVNPLLPKRGYYSIIPKQKFSYSHSNIPVQSPSMYYWQ